MLDYHLAVMSAERGQVTRLLSKIATGDRGAEDELIPIVQADLRRIACVMMSGERPGSTLQATVLVDDVLMKLLHGAPVEWQDRAHFFALAATQMRYILIDHARTAKAQKRGSNAAKLSLDAVTLMAQGRQQEVLEIDEALTRLATQHPQHAQVVEMRVFGGYSSEEIAKILGISDRTVKRYWAFARAWLHRELGYSRVKAASA